MPFFKPIMLFSNSLYTNRYCSNYAHEKMMVIVKCGTCVQSKFIIIVSRLNDL